MERELPRAIVDVAHSLAKAALTLMRTTVEVHQEVLAKVHEVTEAALSKFDEADEPRKR